MVAVTFGIIVFVVFTADHCNNKIHEQITSISDEWEKFAIENDCKIIESYFGMVEKWICDDDEIYWR